MVKRNIVFLSMMVFTALFLVGCSSGVVEIERPAVDDNDIDTDPYFLMTPPVVTYESTEEFLELELSFNVQQMNPSLTYSIDYPTVGLYTYVKLPDMKEVSIIYDNPEMDVEGLTSKLPVCEASAEEFCKEKGYDGVKSQQTSNLPLELCALKQSNNWIVDETNELNQLLTKITCYKHDVVNHTKVEEEILSVIKPNDYYLKNNYTTHMDVIRVSWHMDVIRVSWDDFEQYCGREVIIGSILNPDYSQLKLIGAKNVENYSSLHIQESENFEPAGNVFTTLLYKEYEDTVEIVCS